MEILGIGPSELVFIVLLAIIILGPKDIQKTGKTIGRWLNQLVQSDSWKVFQKTSTEIRNLPRNLMREANLEDVGKELQDTGTQIQDVDKDLRQTIDPRPRPPTPTPAPAPSAPPTPSTEPGAQSSDTLVQDDQAVPPPSNPVETAPQPPIPNPTDVNGEMKQNG